MTLIREIHNSWTDLKHPAAFNAPLSAGLRIVIRDGVIPERRGDVTCEVKGWRYCVDSLEQADLVLIVEEVKQSRFARWFAGLEYPQQLAVGGYIPIGILLVVLGLPALWVYLQTDHTPAWAFAGHYVKGFVGWALFIVVAWIIPWRLRWYTGTPSFSKTFFSVASFLAAFVIVIAWGQIAAYPEGFKGTDMEYATYAQALASKFSKSYWPLLLLALPWVSLAFKTLGLEFAGQATETFAKSRKK